MMINYYILCELGFDDDYIFTFDYITLDSWNVIFICTSKKSEIVPTFVKYSCRTLN